MKFRILTATLALCFLGGPAAYADSHESDHIQVADYLDLEQVSDAQISPDGQQVI